jgi:hypothetical protein
MKIVQIREAKNGQPKQKEKQPGSKEESPRLGRHSSYNVDFDFFDDWIVYDDTGQESRGNHI